MTDLETARSAAKKSANEAFDQLPNTEPERSKHADGLDTIPGAWYQNEMSYLEDELGHQPNDEEEEAYRTAWRRQIKELKAQEDLS